MACVIPGCVILGRTFKTIDAGNRVLPVRILNLFVEGRGHWDPYFFFFGGRCLMVRGMRLSLLSCVFPIEVDLYWDWLELGFIL